MSKRRREHVTGESGELAVATLWTEAGAAVDFVHRDYGEDLLVQTALNGELDASRLWVQVKTRSNPERLRLRSGDLVLRVGVSTAVRCRRRLKTGPPAPVEN